MLLTRNLTKIYQQGETSVSALQNVTMEIPTGASCAIVGPSGSGKSTFLGLCAGLDRLSSGSVQVCGTELAGLSEDELSTFRSRNVGFVFQSFELIPSLTALENVMVPAEILGKKKARAEAHELLSFMGLGERLQHYPSQLSGGEQQRVALARAFVNTPKILFGDEPTGNLDAESGAIVIEKLFQLQREFQTTLILATHNEELAKQNDFLVVLRGGELRSIERRSAT